MRKKSDNAAAVSSVVEYDPGEKLNEVEANGVSASTLIGPSITINGAMSGEEDVMVSGTMNGPIHLTEHRLTIAKTGNAHSNIAARAVRVDGNVEGELDAQQVLVTGSGVVKGSLKMPNITLEDGGRVQGTID
ncbi:MAG: polymer-forming cytoskeletal protein, partial [Gammaproteobacteria bacterium]|nr:polymer-forming cytoskeletal protein [Gammaproteobacteria bacterium]